FKIVIREVFLNTMLTPIFYMSLRHIMCYQLCNSVTWYIVTIDVSLFL
uniref:Uncharacterized protein n=1 Tax=Aegilops tauschii subsp. strangulata TaxID=200361 RepID=A0A453JFG4_AEGTS